MMAAAPAAAQIAVVVHPESQARPMLPGHLAMIFLGQSTALTPVERGRDSAIRRRFYQKLGNIPLTRVEGNWARLEFTGRGTAPRTFSTDSALKKAVASDVNAIGYIDIGAVDRSVKVLLTLP